MRTPASVRSTPSGRRHSTACTLSGRDRTPRNARRPGRRDGVPEFRTTIQPLLAGEVVLHAGEAIAAVVADSRRIAEDAVDLIEVDYEPLPWWPTRRGRRGGELATSIVLDILIDKASNIIGKIPATPCASIGRSPATRVRVPDEGRTAADELYDERRSGPRRRCRPSRSRDGAVDEAARAERACDRRRSSARLRAERRRRIRRSCATCALVIAANRPVQWLSDRREELISSETPSSRCRT